MIVGERRIPVTPVMSSPSVTQFRGFENDGDFGKILFAPNANNDIIDRMKENRKRKRVSTEDNISSIVCSSVSAESDMNDEDNEDDLKTDYKLDEGITFEEIERPVKCRKISGEYREPKIVVFQKVVYLVPLKPMNSTGKKVFRFPCRGPCEKIRYNEYGYIISIKDRKSLGTNYPLGEAVRNSSSRDGKNYFCYRCVDKYNHLFGPNGPCKILYEEVENLRRKVDVYEKERIEFQEKSDILQEEIERVNKSVDEVSEVNDLARKRILYLEKVIEKKDVHIGNVTRKYNNYKREKDLFEYNDVSYKDSRLIDRILYSLTSDLHKFISSIYEVLTSKSNDNEFNSCHYYHENANIRKFPESIVDFFNKFHSKISGRNIEDRELLLRLETFIRDKWSHFNFPHTVNTFNLYRDGASQLIIEFCFVSGTAVRVDCNHKRFSYEKLLDPFLKSYSTEFIKNNHIKEVSSRVLDEDDIDNNDDVFIRTIHGIQHDNFKRKDEKGTSWDHQTELIHIIDLEKSGVEPIRASNLINATKSRSKSRLCSDELHFSVDEIVNEISSERVFDRNNGVRQFENYSLTDDEIKYQKSQANTKPGPMEKGKSSKFQDWLERILALGKAWASLNPNSWNYLPKFSIGDGEYQKHLRLLERVYDYLHFDLSEEEREEKGYKEIDLDFVPTLMGIFCTFHVQFDFYCGASPRKIKKKTGGFVSFRNVKKFLAPLLLSICGRDDFPTCFDFGFSDFHRYFVAINNVWKKHWRELLSGIDYEHDKEDEVEEYNVSDPNYKKIYVPNAVGHITVNVFDEFIPLMIDLSDFLHTPPSKYRSFNDFLDSFFIIVKKSMRYCTIQNHHNVLKTLVKFLNDMERFKKSEDMVPFFNLVMKIFFMLYGEKIEFVHGDLTMSCNRMNRGENSIDNINYINNLYSCECDIEEILGRTFDSTEKTYF